MPTPVTTARQCLTDEAARALDDAVSVARRRNHAQTTSLHVVSAFLSLPSSLLREACTRARSSAYSPRLQFRALELSVGVSLDRLPCSKNQADDAPPISNSLMAAIKRSQANQRRQPEMYHLNQIQIQNGNPMSLSSIKVELKQFVLSILDDPIVSRVFGEAGFRSCDIKLAIVHPPISPPSRYLRARCPPLFLCNLTDNGFPVSRNIPFPFAAGGGADASGDAYCKRIEEVLVRKSGRNPLLVGVCAREALFTFKEYVEKKGSGEGETSGSSLLPGLSFLCMEKEIKDLVENGETAMEAVDLKIKEVNSTMEKDSGAGAGARGVALSFGDLKALVDDSASIIDAVKCLVFKLSGLVELHKNKLWLIGAAEDYETYSKFVERFPSIERDWDLHPLPITSSRASVEGLYSKSSLMRSFVPFGGFFSAPSEFRNPLSVTAEPFFRCGMCNEKYEREVSATLNERGSYVSIADQCSSSLPSWLQMADSNVNKAGKVEEQAKDDKAATNAKVLGLQKKWDDICQRLHRSPTFSRPDILLSRTEVPRSPGVQFVADKQGSGSGRDLYLNGRVCSDFTSCSPVVSPKGSPEKQDGKYSVVSVERYGDSQFKPSSKTSMSLAHDMDRSPLADSSICTSTLPRDHTSGSSFSSVTTDLGLGTIFAPKGRELRRGSLQHLPDSTSVALETVREKTSEQRAQSSSSTSPELRERLDPACYKPLWKELSKRVGWQDEVVHSISKIVSSCKSGYGRPRAPKSRGDIWVSFLGPDKVGKRKIAEALADVVCGSRESLIAVDLSCQERVHKPNSIFYSQALDNFNEVSRKTVVGYVAEQLSRKPHSVVFLENVDEADLLVQNSLSRAIQTGKFPDCHGREISITNTIFVIASGSRKEEESHERYSEQRILEAKHWQMRIRIGYVTGEVKSPSKRKLLDSCDPIFDPAKRSNKTAKNCFDLNLPLEESEEASDMENSDSTSISDNSRAWLEDFLEQGDGKVMFKNFDFDALADRLMKQISSVFEKKMGSRMRIEVDDEAMVEMLAAAWSSYKEGSVEGWVEEVLGASFAEAQQSYCFMAPAVVKLEACEGLPIREHAPGTCLPSKINLT